MMLREFGIDITPVLTGAGIAGLAVGFGAQTLVRDIISGFFLILEDQVRVGDVAAINGVGGLVEQINLRTIVLRDEEGAVHVFPNGAINDAGEPQQGLLVLRHHAGAAVQRGSRSHRRDSQAGRPSSAGRPRYGPFILDPIEILGIDAFGDWAMQLKMRIKTMPLKQWEVGRELRRRIRMALNQAGVACRSRRWAPAALAAASQAAKSQPAPDAAQ